MDYRATKTSLLNLRKYWESRAVLWLVLAVLYPEPAQNPHIIAIPTRAIS